MDQENSDESSVKTNQQIKNTLVDQLDGKSPVIQSQVALDRREKSADLGHLTSLSEDENEVERMRLAVQNLVFSPSETSLKKPSEGGYINEGLDENRVPYRRDQTVYNYKLAAIDTDSV